MSALVIDLFSRYFKIPYLPSLNGITNFYSDPTSFLEIFLSIYCQILDFYHMSVKDLFVCFLRWLFFVVVHFLYKI